MNRPTLKDATIECNPSLTNGRHYVNETEDQYKNDYDTDYLNVYSFALKPEHQPSGTCNFSRIDAAVLHHDCKIGSSYESGSADHFLNVYAINYNVLRIMSGMGGLAYSN